MGNAPITITEIEVAPPAAGADFSFVPSTNQHWRLSSIFALFTTSATVANRTPHLQIKDLAGVVVADIAAQVSIAASLSPRFTWLRSWSNWTGGPMYDSAAVVALPGTWWPPGWSITTKTGGLQAADTWTTIVAVVELVDFPTDEA